MDRKSLENLYDLLKTVDPKSTAKMTAAEYEKSGFCKAMSLNGMQGKVIAKILAAAAHTYTMNEFCGYLSNNEFPPIKLSKDEMRVLKGAGFQDKWDSVLYGFQGVGYAFSARCLLLSGDKLDDPEGAKEVKKRLVGWAKNVDTYNAMYDGYEKAAQNSFINMWDSWNKK